MKTLNSVMLNLFQHLLGGQRDVRLSRVPLDAWWTLKRVQGDGAFCGDGCTPC